MLKNIVNKETREKTIKSNLVDHLKNIVQSLLCSEDGVLHLSAGSAKGPVLGHSDNTNSLCNVLEAIFVHELKHGMGEKFAKIFRSNIDKMPVPNFWPVIMTISHRDLIEQVTQLNFINSDVGKARCWLRLVLNQGQLVSYLTILASDARLLRDYYKPLSFLRDTEICDLMIHVVQPLSNISFSLATNVAVLNTWTQTPLVLAGIWMPSICDMPMAEPVLPATDIASTIEDNPTSNALDIPSSQLSEEMFDIIIKGTPEMRLEEYYCPVPEQPDPIDESTEPMKEEIESVDVIPAQQSTLMNRSVSTIVDDGEYENLFADFSVSGTTDTLPSYLALYKPRPPISLEMTRSLEKIREDEPEYEVISGEIPADYRSDYMLPLLCILTQEEGLDVQNYICFRENCSNHIGLQYGAPRLCKYEGRYYCHECHEGDTAVIPGRILYNWDFKGYPVCGSCKTWLNSIAMLPLINICSVNSKLYRCFDELAQVQLLRIELYYIQAYLFSCRLDDGSSLRKMFWPRDHLFEHVSSFALLDLQQIYNGKLVTLLSVAVSEGRNHILNCELCSLRGFICEICKSDQIIYPFQLSETFTCSNCCGVFHKTCITSSDDCPKCERRKKAGAIES